jgi:hypothetical protein
LKEILRRKGIMALPVKQTSTMNPGKSHSAALLLGIALASVHALSAAPQAGQTNGRLKVNVLAGQSNMQGHVNIAISAKIMAPIGKAFAEALLKLRKTQQKYP